MAEEKVTVKIGNKEYELVLTTLALEEILDKFGCDFDTLGSRLKDELSKKNPITIVGWLITLLANQSILIKNELEGKSEKLLDEKTVKLLTNLADITPLTIKIADAISKGLSRNVTSEENVKNVESE